MPISSHSPSSSPQPLTTTNLLSVSLDMLILDISYKQNHTVCDLLCLSQFLNARKVGRIENIHILTTSPGFVPVTSPGFALSLICPSVCVSFTRYVSPYDFFFFFTLKNLSMESVQILRAHPCEFLPQ